jgi:hypothetical protein
MDLIHSQIRVDPSVHDSARIKPVNWTTAHTSLAQSQTTS